MSIADKLTQIAENQQAVYDTGYRVGESDGYNYGYQEGYDTGFAAGQAQGGGGSYDQGYADAVKDEYDRFWDSYQDKGKRTVYNIYQGGFAGPYWTDETFRPKYPIVTTDAAMMFRATQITDLTKTGVSLDFTGCKAFNYAFAYSGNYLRKLPQLDLSSANNLLSTFDSYGGSELSLIVSESTKFDGSTFKSVLNLVNLTIEGVIGVSLNLQHSSLLSNDSVQNIIDCLKDLTGATAQKLTLHKTVVANMTQVQKDAISAKNWTLVSG